MRKQMWKRGMTLILACLMAFCVTGCSGKEPEEETETETDNEQTAVYQDGVFTASSYGMSGDVPVTVTVKNGKIVSIEVGENSETQGIGSMAIEQLPDLMIAAQSPEVDIISGATVTSKALISAVTLALTQNNEDNKTENVVTEADVIVVGAGLSGLVAADRSAELGASVIVLEQSGGVGGSSRYAGGYVSGACTQLQKEAGIDDSYEMAYQDFVRIGGEDHFNHDLAWMHAQRAGELVDWIGDVLGLELSEPGFGAYTPTNVARAYETAGGGIDYANATADLLNSYVSNGNVTLLLNTQVTDLILDGDTVIGVRDANGTEYTATGGVILATGGYGHNEAWVSRYNFAHSRTQAPATATGSGFDLAESVGASFSNMEYLPAYAGGVDTNEDTYELTVIANTEGWSGAVWVDLDGNRHADEAGFTTAQRQAVWENSKENYVFIVFTDKMMEEAESPLFDVDAANGSWERFNQELAEGYCVFSGGTIEELADVAGINAAGLTATLEQYDSYAAAGKDEDFGRTQNLISFEDGETFYAVRTIPYLLLTKGGVDIDTGARVLRADGSFVDGLFACGELIGGANIGGFGSHGGLAHTICFVWGTIAAESAVSRAVGEEVHVEGFRGVTEEIPEA